MTDPACPACRTAIAHPESGHLIDGCLGCKVRRASKVPRDVRQAMVDAVRDVDGDEAATKFERAAIDEYHRRQAWKRAVGHQDRTAK